MQLDNPLAVVTPTLDASVLAVLARTRGSYTPSQVHQLLSRGSEDGVQKVLRRLTDQGIVVAQHVGKAFSYQFNHEHVAAQPIIALAAAREEFLARLRGSIATWPTPPVYAAVFGSAARGGMGADSDIDLLLIRSDDEAEDEWNPLVRELIENALRWTGNDLRPLELTVSEFFDRVKDRVIVDASEASLTVAGSAAWFRRAIRTGGRP